MTNPLSHASSYEKQTPREIAEAVMAYSQFHENDALMSTESGGDMRFVGWEVPYYCMTLQGLESDIIAEGFSTVAEAIRVMSKGFAEYHSYKSDICAEADAEHASHQAEIAAGTADYFESIQLDTANRLDEFDELERDFDNKRFD